MNEIYTLSHRFVIITSFLFYFFNIINAQQCPNSRVTFKDSVLNNDTLKVCFGAEVTLVDSSIIDPADIGATLDFIDVDWGDGIRDTSLSSEDRTHTYTSSDTFTVVWMVKNKDVPSPCIDTVEKIVVVGSALSVTITVTNSIDCNGDVDGQLTGTITGGTSTYNYNWGTTLDGTEVADVDLSASLTNVQSSLGPDDYFLTVTDAYGCIAKGTSTISEPNQLDVSLSIHTQIDCNGGKGKVSASVSGGTPNYDYKWGTSLGGSEKTSGSNSSLSSFTTSLYAADEYYFNITDANGCSINDSITLSEPSSIGLTMPSNVTIQSGESATLTATGAASYSWTEGITNGIAFVPNTTKTYVCTATEGGICQEASVTVTVENVNYYVATDGDDTNDGLSISAPKASLGDVISDYNLGRLDTIFVAAGNYTESGITTYSSDDKFVVKGAGTNSTVFDGAEADQFLNLWGDSIVLQDMTIKNMKESGDGGAVEFYSSDGSVLKNIIFEACTSNSDDGGGVYIYNGSLEVNSCVFKSCKAYVGAAIAAKSSDHVKIINSLFYENDATLDGIVFSDLTSNYSDSMLIINCTFADNGSSDGVVYNDNGVMMVKNSIISDQESSYSIKRYSGTVHTYNNFLRKTTNGTIASSENNITSGDVSFVSAATDDYRIKSNSVCINAGVSSGAPNKDINGDNRDDGSIDMGCYEYSCSSPNAGIVDSSSTICRNNPVSLSVSGTSAGPIKWQESSDNSSWTDVSTGSGYTTSSFTSEALTSTTYYRVAASCDGSNYSATSNTVTSTVASGTLYVDDGGSDSNSGTSSGSPFLTLSHALSQATCGYTINVAAGTYTDDLLDITSTHDGVTIAGAGIGSTIFEQSGTGDHFMEIKSSVTNITIKDLKIKGYDEADNGGAIDITTSGSVTIENVHFDGNSTTTSYDEGAAISTINATTNISKCIFSNNSTANQNSVSIVYTEGGMTMENCLFYDNSAASTSYSGIVKIDDGTNTITNCTFTENSGGDVVYIWDGNTTYIKNCLFYNNTGSYDVEEHNTHPNDPVMINCYYEGRTGSFAMGSESGNLTSGTVGFTDAAINDFSLACLSVCRDAGTSSGAPSTDINGNNRNDGNIDIGCYEFDASSVSLSISSNTVNSITDSSAESGGLITCDAGQTIIGSGVVWDTISNPTIESKLGITTENATSGSFTSNIAGLLQKTTYYTRAYITSTEGTVYGAEDTFITEPTLFDKTAIEGSLDGKNVLSDLYWKYSLSQQIYLKQDINTAGLIKHLYFKYDGNTEGTRDIVVYLKHTSKSSYTSKTDWESISNSDKVFEGQLNLDNQNGWYSIKLDSAFNYNNTDNLLLVIDDNSNSYFNSSSDFFAESTSNTRTLLYRSDGTNATPLSPPTASLDLKYIANLKISFDSSTVDSSLSLPEITTESISSITDSSAISGGNIVSDYGNSITSSGIVWSTSSSPTIVSNSGITSEDSSAGVFVSNLDSLNEGTYYYVRAYATNSNGSSYGDQKLFRSNGLPILSTNSIESITNTSAVSGGRITNNGGVTITASGVVWDTVANPTINSKIGITAENVSTGSFTSNINDLSVGKTYYVRAYATNSFGTSYGAQYSFTAITNPNTDVVDGSTSSQNVVSDLWYNYSLSQQIYLNEEINNAGNITSIYFKYDGDKQGVREIKLYLKHTSKTSFSSTTDWITISNDDLFYEGQLNLDNQSGWYGVSLDSSFVYNNTDNLLLVVDDNSDDYLSSNADFYSKSGSSRTLIYRNDQTNPNPLSPPTATSKLNYIGNLRLVFDSTVVNTPNTIPVLATIGISNITDSTAVSGGTIDTNGGAAITASGVVWDTVSNPTVDNKIGITNEDSLSGSYVSNVSNLLASTTYYIRAYATNAVGTAYGVEDTFITLDSNLAPSIITTIPNSITDSSAVSGGSIDTNGGAAISASGVVWDTVSNPTIESKLGITNEDSTSGSFVSNLDSLESGTIYYVRAYATNSVGTAYGMAEVFTTPLPATLPTLSLVSVGDVTDSSAISGGTIDTNGGAAITVSGVVWDTVSNPSTETKIGITSENATSGTYSSNITGLIANKTYYVRAYAINSVGTAYSLEESFTTNQTATIPNITTISVNTITDSSASSGGVIVNNGGEEISNSGVVWATFSNPTTDNNVGISNIDSTSGTFVSGIPNLSAATTYYVRAYAANYLGTAYGVEDTFMTLASEVTPSITTASVSSITDSSAISGGTIDTNGGAAITASGVVWDTVSNPTIESKLGITNEDSTSGSFVSNLDSLEIGKTYYVRAYATNSEGTAYGVEDTFTINSKQFGAGVTDIDGNTYGSVIIGQQEWLSSNLKVTKYNDGTPISEVSDGSDWSGLSSPAWCWYNNDSASYDSLHGKLYNYYAVADTNSRNVCPEGWKVPTSNDWDELINYLNSQGHDGYEAQALKTNYNWDGTDHFAFNALPSGYRYDSGSSSMNGSIFDVWSSQGWYQMINNSVTGPNSGYKNYGFSVRCIKDTSHVATSIPTITTASVSSITDSSAVSGGTIDTNGGAAITASGVVWGVSANPTIANNVGLSIENTTSGSFVSNITGLEEGVIYYVRAYATNSEGTAYGTQYIIQTLVNCNTNITITQADINTDSSILHIDHSPSIAATDSITALSFVIENQNSVVYNLENNSSVISPSLSNGTYTLTSILATDLGCADTSLISVVFADSNICEENQVYEVIQDTSINAAGIDEYTYTNVQSNLSANIRLNGDTSVCGGFANDIITLNPSGGVAYSVGEVSFTGSYAYSITASEVIVLQGTDANGCIGEDSIAVVIHTLSTTNQVGIMVDSVPEAIDSAELCAGSSFEFTAWGAAESATYDFYKISNGIDNLMSSSSVTSSGGAHGAVASYTATDLEDGDSIYVITTDANGCTMPTSKIGVSVLANPSLAVSIPEMCEGSTFDITTSGVDSVIFLINGGTVQSGAVNSYSYTAVLGDYLSVKGYNGACSATFEDSILNIEAIPEVSLTNDALNNTVCRDSVVNFVASGADSFVYKIKDAAGEYLVSNSGSTYSTDSMGANDTLVLYSYYKACQIAPIKMHLMLEECITTCPLMIAGFNYTIDGLTITASDSSFGSITNYQWSMAEEAYLSGREASYTFASSGYYDICLTVYDSLTDCSDQYCVSIELKEDSADITCHASFDYSLVNDTIHLANTSQGAYTNVLWSFSDGSVAGSLNPVKALGYGIHEVCLKTLDSLSGCQSSICQTVVIESDSEEVVSCYADFDYYMDIETYQAHFTNKSMGDVSRYYWQFGDGAISFEDNPSHTYPRYDAYDVTLITIDEETSCQSEITKTIKLKDEETEICNASFDYFVDASQKKVVFTNTSVGNFNQIHWNFGDASYSTDTSGEHYYERSGHYNVTLSVFNLVSYCQSSYTASIEVIDSSSQEEDCEAIFTLFPDVANQMISIDNKSLGSNLNYFWSVSNGLMSFEQEPVFTIEENMYLDVCLTVMNAASNCQSKYCVSTDFIDSSLNNDSVICNADFEFYPDVAAELVLFNNTSKGTYTDVYWEYGDGSTGFGMDSVHVYAKADIYNVVLNVYDSVSGCHSSIEKHVELLDSGAVACVADFNFVPDLTTKRVNYNNASLGGVDRYYWNFGNGKFSDEESPVITYDQYGYHEVCLTVFDDFSSCQDRICKNIALIDSSSENCKANFKYLANRNNKKRIRFKHKNKGSVTSHYWDFGDGNNAFTKKTENEYLYGGLYDVTYTVFNNENGCQSSIKKTVNVEGDRPINCQAKMGYYPLENSQISFSNESTGDIHKVLWVFGDGKTSREFNPINSYQRSGNYEVILHVYDTINEIHSMIEQEIEVIDSEAVYCKAEFSYYPSENGTSVKFTSHSVAENIKYDWDFGNGLRDSSQIVDVSYDVAGYYLVKLTIIDEENGCMDSYEKEVMAGRESASDSNCMARFSYEPEDKTIKLTNKSIGNYKEVFWNFGDGFNSEVESEVYHNYESNGYYDITLTIVDTNTNCFDTKTATVSLIENSNDDYCHADFDYVIGSRKTVKFINKSHGNIKSYYWDFGDGSNPYSGGKPKKRYSNDGYYEVCLTVVTQQGCQNTTCEVIGVGDLTNACYADFDYFIKSDIGFAKFNNKSLGESLNYTWDFGDDVSSEQEHPGHSYADIGYYPVCLTVNKSNGACQAKKCKDINMGNALWDKCLINCVWPGDANDDLEANHYDILDIGLNYGRQGPKRDSVSSLWIGHQSTHWTRSTNGVNNMHADCNGDGMINYVDTLVVTENFAYSHYREYKKKAEGAELSLVVQGDVQPGEPITIDVIAGDDITPLTMYGIGFELVLDAEEVDISTATVSWADSWLDDEGEDPEVEPSTYVDDWGNDDIEEGEDLWADSWPEEDIDDILLTYSAIDEDETAVLVTTTKKDGRNVTDAGVIATVTVMVKPDIAADVLGATVFSSGGVKADGSQVEFANDQIYVEVEKTQAPEFELSDLEVFPNPSTGEVRFYLSLNDLHDIQIMDMSGRLVYYDSQVSGGLKKLDLSALDAGLYTMSVNSANTIQRARFQIIR